MLSDAMEDYLKALYILQSGGDDRVSTSELAEYVDKTSPTVTSMLGKLAERGLVEREKYKGAHLTDEGETVALEVLRHHRLLETYLTERLDYSWSEVHEEADALEHHISEEFERRVADVLGDPEVDPHGDPIPSADLEPLADDDAGRLADCEEGMRVRVTRVRDRDREELDYLERAGVTPGAVLELVDVAPFGMVTVRTDEGEQSLPREVADSIGVRRLDAGGSRPAGVGGA